METKKNQAFKTAVDGNNGVTFSGEFPVIKFTGDRIHREQHTPKYYQILALEGE